MYGKPEKANKHFVITGKRTKLLYLVCFVKDVMARTLTFYYF